MNERIRELVDKIWAEEYWDNPNTDKLLPAQLDKFAEFIIRECIANCNDLDSMKFIADHFEIKIPGLNDEIF
jgi:hypothetical protein